jgi:tRNA U38,U39,U40 pseudouridine synthase TruA
MDPSRRLYCAHVFYPIDLTLFEACLSEFVGTHDFKAFGNRIERSLCEFEEKEVEFSTVRTIHSIKLLKDDCSGCPSDTGSASAGSDIDSARDSNGYYKVEFILESAIYRMVRNIVGSCLHVAAGSAALGYSLGPSEKKRVGAGVGVGEDSFGGRGLRREDLVMLLKEAPFRAKNPAMSAPPHGLNLEHVFYDHY